MGINLEYATLLTNLKLEKKILNGSKCLEFGAQEISADAVSISQHIKRCGLKHSVNTIDSAKIFYNLFGYTDYICIDATSEHASLVFDINKNIKDYYNYNESFDLVTDLGTFEHVFNIAVAFQNAHDLCRIGGLMVHVLPSNCNINHGYYAIQPRLILDIAESNSYEIIEFVFTVDYKPYLYRYNIKNYKAYDDRDLMFYVVFHKNIDMPFKYPFDSIFIEKNKLSDYKKTTISSELFYPYIKGSWENVKPNKLSNVPVDILSNVKKNRIYIKNIIDRIGNL